MSDALIMKILLTGASGFIGGALLKVLSKECLTVLGRSTPQGFSGKATIKSMSGSEDYLDCLLGVDVVIHLAAVAHNLPGSLNYMEEVNVSGTLNLASQAAEQGVKRFIFISSIGVLGNKTESPFTEKTVAAPHSKYAESKFKAENLLLDLSDRTGLDVVIIRPVLVYGAAAPGNFSKLIGLVKRTHFLPFGIVNNKRSFISVDNLASFIKLCTIHPEAKNQIFNISDDHDISILTFTNAIKSGLSLRLFQLPIPVFLFTLLGKIFERNEQVEQLVGDLQVDVSKARNLLNWNPAETMSQAMAKLK